MKVTRYSDILIKIDTSSAKSGVINLNYRRHLCDCVSRSILLTSLELEETTCIDCTRYLHSLSQYCSQYLYHLEIAVWCRALFQECMLGTAAIWNTRQRTVTTIFWYDPIFLSTLQRSGGWKISWLYGARRSTSAFVLFVRVHVGWNGRSRRKRQSSGKRKIISH